MLRDFFVIILVILGVARLGTAYLANDQLDDIVSSFMASPLPRPFSKKISNNSQKYRNTIILETINGDLRQVELSELIKNNVKEGPHRRWIPYQVMLRYSGGMSGENRRHFLRVSFCGSGLFAQGLQLIDRIRSVKIVSRLKGSKAGRETIVRCGHAES